MRNGLVVLGISVLSLLLALSAPVATTDTVHGGALVHAAVPHLHPGRSTGSVGSRNATISTPAPSITVAAGVATHTPTLGLTPPLPESRQPFRADLQRLARPPDFVHSTSYLEAPPDRPPSWARPSPSV